MSFRSPRAPMHVSRTLLAITWGLTLAACGGGTGQDPTEVPSASASTAAQPLPAATALKADVVNVTHAVAAPVFVNVEGCVLDRHYIPVTGTSVRALAADGRLLGNAQSDGHGRFTLRLPTHSDVTLQIDRPSGESLPMVVGDAASTWEKCLLDDQA